MKKQLDNPFDRAERIRLLEAEISFNANAISNTTIIMRGKDRQSEFCVVEPLIEWYEKELEKLREGLQEWMSSADAEYITFKIEGNK